MHGRTLHLPRTVSEPLCPQETPSKRAQSLHGASSMAGSICSEVRLVWLGTTENNLQGGSRWEQWGSPPHLWARQLLLSAMTTEIPLSILTHAWWTCDEVIAHHIHVQRRPLGQGARSVMPIPNRNLELMHLNTHHVSASWQLPGVIAPCSNTAAI